MAGTTPVTAFRYPTGPDAPNVPSDMRNLAQDVEDEFVGPLTTNLHLLSASDLRWNGGDTTLARRSAGILTTPGQALMAAPYLHAYQGTPQTLTNTVWSAVSMTVEVIDNINGHSNVSLTTRYVPPIAGYYDCQGLVMFVGSTAGDRAAQFRFNGTQIANAPYGSAPALNGAGFVGGSCTCFGTIFCNGTTDYIELWAIQNSGGNLDTLVTAGVTTSTMKIRWVSHS